MLDYAVTSNHIHLLVQDHGHGEIARSMQLESRKSIRDRRFPTPELAPGIDPSDVARMAERAGLPLKPRQSV